MRWRSSSKRGKKGFTLVELLVVIAVIAILVALLLPALGRAKTAANRAVCVSNFRQQGIGLALYVEDHGVFPRTLWSGGIPGATVWMQALSPYVKDKWPTKNWTGAASYAPGPDARWAQAPAKSVFACPGYDHVRGIYATHPHRPCGAYAYNGIQEVSPPTVMGRLVFLDGGIAADKDLKAIRESAVLKPSRMIAIGDSTIVPGESLDVLMGLPIAPIFIASIVAGDDYLPNRNLGPLSRVKQAMLRRHGNRWNMLFVDGHVESEHPRKYFDVRSDEVLALWNRDNRAHRQ
jgi:prepilin-type N-terminal cleavage/methylation domain-containing protein/prepilin-type processing-associated H-X9-DG protein